MSAVLYFVAIIPPGEICGAITSIKHDIKERFGSSHALRLIPHITLKAPFSSNDQHPVKSWFDNIAAGVTPFTQHLINFNCFANKKNPLIFIEPLLNEPLRQLQRNIIAGFTTHFPGVTVSQNEMDFHPHITVGYRDLSYRNFQLAWNEYREKKFEASFVVENFCLLQHDRKQWNIVAVHPLL